MVGCSNPVSCQMAKRVECSCECHGANHGILRVAIENPDTREAATQQLDNLKVEQANIKKEKKLARRKARAAVQKPQSLTDDVE